jgi:hypothetical protein
MSTLDFSPQIRYNNTDGKLYYYNGEVWKVVGGDDTGATSEEVFTKGITIDGLGVPIIATGTSYGYTVIPVDSTIIGWDITADISGSIAFDIKVVGVSIIGAGIKPTLVSQQTNSGLVAGWTDAVIAANEKLEFIAISSATVTRVTLTLFLTSPFVGNDGAQLQSDWNQSNASLADYIKNKPVLSNAGWGLVGNIGTDPVISFLGTTDVKKLVFRTGNEKRFGIADTYAKIETYSSGSNTGPTGGFYVNAGNATMKYLDSNIGICGGRNGLMALSKVTDGYYNVGIGEGVLDTLTTGQMNVAIGYNAMSGDSNPVTAQPMTGIQNIGIGVEAIKLNETGYNNIAIGPGVMQYSKSSFYNVAIGQWCIIDGTTANYNVCVGHGAGMGLVDGVRNVSIGGASSFLGMNTSLVGNDSDNVYIGEGAGGERGGGNKNVVIGGRAVTNFNSGLRGRGQRNINIGYSSGSTNNAITDSIVIGSYVSLASETLAGQMNIGNVLYATNMYVASFTTPVYSSAPTATGSIGIGVTTPTARLHLPASTTTIASLKLDIGIAPTTPNNGDIWFDGTNLKMQIAGATKTFTLV